MSDQPSETQLPQDDEVHFIPNNHIPNHTSGGNPSGERTMPNESAGGNPASLSASDAEVVPEPELEVVPEKPEPEVVVPEPEPEVAPQPVIKPGRRKGSRRKK